MSSYFASTKQRRTVFIHKINCGAYANFSLFIHPKYFVIKNGISSDMSAKRVYFNNDEVRTLNLYYLFVGDANVADIINM